MFFTYPMSSRFSAKSGRRTARDGLSAPPILINHKLGIGEKYNATQYNNQFGSRVGWLLPWQKPKCLAEKPQPAGKRKEDHRTLRRSWESIGFNETAGLNQSSGGAQNNVRNGISFLRSTGWSTCFRRTDSGPHGRDLKGLSSQDPMKSSLDQASYNDEFRDLQIQLYQMSQQTFNGVSLFAQYATDSSGQPDTAQRPCSAVDHRETTP